MSIPQGTPILMTIQRALKLGETRVGLRRQTEQVGQASYGSARTGLRRPSPAAPLVILQLTSGEVQPDPRTLLKSSIKLLCMSCVVEQDDA